MTEKKEMGQEATLDAVAEKAKEVLLRDNFVPSRIYYLGSEGEDDLFAFANWEQMRDLAEDAPTEFSVGKLKKIFVVFRGYYGRLGETSDTEFEEKRGFNAIRIKDGKPGNSVGFEPWATGLREVLTVTGADVDGKTTKQVIDDGGEAIIYEIVRNENGDATSLNEIYKGPAKSTTIEAFVWGYTEWGKNRKPVSPE